MPTGRNISCVPKQEVQPHYHSSWRREDFPSGQQQTQLTENYAVQLMRSHCHLTVYFPPQMLHLFSCWWLTSLSCSTWLKSHQWCLTPWSISLSSEWNAAWFMNHLLESVYYKFKVNLQMYSVNFCFLIYWWQQRDRKRISDDIWRQGETTVVPTHPLSSPSFLPFMEVVSKLLLVCTPFSLHLCP